MIKTYSLTTTKIIKRLLKDYGKDHVYSFVWANILMVLVAISTALLTEDPSIYSEKNSSEANPV